MKPLHWPVCAKSLGRTACKCRASSSKQQVVLKPRRGGSSLVQEDVPAHPSVSLPYFEERSSAERDGPSSSLSGVAQTLPDAAAVGQRVPPTCGVAYETPLVLRSTGFQVQTNEPSSPPGKEKQVDYYANVGDAIRTLRDDIPQLFVKDLNYKIYREDIVFRDPNLYFKGLKNYKIIFWSLRFHGRLFFSRISVDILRVWQPEDHQIKLRWRVHGIPRVWWEAEGIIDGISTYKLDSEGSIYEHAVDNVQLRDPPITNPLLYGLNYVWAPRLHPQPQPCPGSWFTTSIDESKVTTDV